MDFIHLLIGMFTVCLIIDCKLLVSRGVVLFISAPTAATTVLTKYLLRTLFVMLGNSLTFLV